MTPPLRLVLILHNHQPIGNFDGVFEQAYQDSYLPFLDVYERFDGLPIALHTSGSLMEWLAERHPEYVDRVARLVEAGRIEIVGGPFFEPILTMIPSRDRVGQIEQYTDWLRKNLGASVHGMWMPERVWEQSLTRDIVDAGMKFTLLDDFHFKAAGWTQDELHGYYLTEDDGRLLAVFPGSEKLRYTIPFAEPQATIDYLQHVQSIRPGAVVVFGDDGEKFGTWPDTKAHVYDNGWLHQFFEALAANSSWLKVTTPSEALESVAPLGKMYIPEGSYREMTEWALPSQQLENFEDLHHDFEERGQWEAVKPFVRGGYWRNFKAKYPETGEMYARMQMVSRRLDTLKRGGAAGELIEFATTALYRGQCNCSYWHGAFGGTYLPHLRNAVFNQLIAADNLMDEYEGRGWVDGDAWIELDAADYNFDGRQEARLATNRLVVMAEPHAGGRLYEIDIRTICHNLLATLARRPEAYHRKVLAGPSADGGNVASIHDRVVFKQENLDQEVVYDAFLRKMLIDHFYDLDVDHHAVVRNEYREQGDFVDGSYEAKLRRSADRMQLQMSRDGHVDGHPVRITKGVTMVAGGDELEIVYLLEGLPTDRPVHFGVEFNFAGMPSGADDRYFATPDDQQLGQLGERLDLHDQTGLTLVDEWLGLACRLGVNQPTSVWTFPIATVSQSEGGFELVHQSVAVIPHWILQADEQGRWSVSMRLAIDTSLAESRRQGAEVAAEA
jgi:alpha-amylase